MVGRGKKLLDEGLPLVLELLLPVFGLLVQRLELLAELMLVGMASFLFWFLSPSSGHLVPVALLDPCTADFAVPSQWHFPLFATACCGAIDAEPCHGGSDLLVGRSVVDSPRTGRW